MAANSFGGGTATGTERGVQCAEPGTRRPARGCQCAGAGVVSDASGRASAAGDGVEGKLASWIQRQRRGSGTGNADLAVGGSDRGACGARAASCDDDGPLSGEGSHEEEDAGDGDEQQGEVGAVWWMTVSMFGECDIKNNTVPNYSMDISKIWEMRKQNKHELSRASLIRDEELLLQQQQKAM
ncbi:hypothetical protein ABZP36_018374, partial [Zizania latifolia]